MIMHGLETRLMKRDDNIQTHPQDDQTTIAITKCHTTSHQNEGTWKGRRQLKRNIKHWNWTQYFGTVLI